jgi:Tfp pilus assembly protein PilN
VSKTTEQALLVPGESGWEIWTRQGDGDFTPHSATGIARAGELTDIPAGELTMLFPVKSLTAVPMRVTSDDDALFPDLAALHAERLGLRPDPMAGQLTDVFVVARDEENTALLSVFLRSPEEGDLPRRGPKGFDISARAWPVAGEGLVIWMEFGRWVFAIFHQGKLAYCQATSVDAPEPDASLAREIRLSLMQLGMQGLHFEPSRVIVWSAKENLDTSGLENVFKARIEHALRPAPVLPDPLSKLLPADVRAARKQALRQRNIIIAAAAVVLAYLGLVGWFGYGLWQTSSTARKLLAEAAQVAPEGEAYALHIAKWDELAQAIELKHSPVDILQRIASCIPPNSGLRLKTAEISAMEINLTGEAQQFPAVKTFSLNLSKNNDLAHFTWQTPEPKQSTRGWEFTYTGEIPTTESEP